MTIEPSISNEDPKARNNPSRVVFLFLVQDGWSTAAEVAAATNMTPSGAAVTLRDMATWGSCRRRTQDGRVQFAVFADSRIPRGVTIQDLQEAGIKVTFREAA